MNPTVPVLQVKHLRTYYRTRNGLSRAVDDISFDLRRGQTLALLGESGCGKSATALSVIRLVPKPAGWVVRSGDVLDGVPVTQGSEILFDNKDLLALPEAQMRPYRGSKITMIFQEPLTSLNPVYTVGDQLMEVVQLHQGLRGQAARQVALEMFKKVGIPSPEARLDEYPHQLSGGMRQRVMIAIALACKPDVLIADEPTTALDVTIQAQILDLLKDLQREFGMAVLLITHDLGVVAQMADEVAVMYAGKVVERGSVQQVFNHSRHPYTQGLFASLPGRQARGQKLCTIEGTVPESTNFPTGCRFNTRCPHRFAPCAGLEPLLLPQADGVQVACHLYTGVNAHV
ncbi:ABC transporter ATP-binding protein [Candidatus Cyanaurora vandensis]|uniref:ABC transporter ATP-binding protein n=1 Tax=Candidatus Cyanaurora vandensis TaxID=2714958 RepID=UPI00257BD272|nr:ABC transporter ATP-binding protein [Candidatus Cyanaurora vandensis]